MVFKTDLASDLKLCPRLPALQGGHATTAPYSACKSLAEGSAGGGLKGKCFYKQSSNMDPGRPHLSGGARSSFAREAGELRSPKMAGGQRGEPEGRRPLDLFWKLHPGVAQAPCPAEGGSSILGCHLPPSLLPDRPSGCKGLSFSGKLQQLGLRRWRP